MTQGFHIFFSCSMPFLQEGNDRCIQERLSFSGLPKQTGHIPLLPCLFALVDDEPVQRSLAMCTPRMKVEAGCLSWSSSRKSTMLVLTWRQAMIVAGVKSYEPCKLVTFYAFWTGKVQKGLVYSKLVIFGPIIYFSGE